MTAQRISQSLQEAAALLGLEVWPVDGGGWIVRRWGLWRQARSDAEVWAVIRALERPCL